MNAPDSSPAARLLRAVAEAKKGIGLTAPNPPVGAVITSEDGNILGTGYHRRAGTPHAEVEAIASAIKNHGPQSCRGATIYITLEPCSTTGKTPPCCDAIRQAGIANVVWGANDPNPAHAGRARSILTDAGISVNRAEDSAADACHALIRPFAKWVTQKIPWIIAKVGSSLDGRITRPPGESQWITSPAAREDAHRLRSEVDAILVGANTVRTDNPSLTIRGTASNPEKTQPWRAIITRTGNLPESATLFTDPHRDRTLVYQNQELQQTLADLAGRGCLSVLVEGGANLHGQLFSAGLIDEICFYLAPRICGGGTPAIGGLEFPPNANSLELKDPEITVLPDQNIRVRALVSD